VFNSKGSIMLGTKNTPPDPQMLAWSEELMFSACTLLHRGPWVMHGTGSTGSGTVERVRAHYWWLCGGPPAGMCSTDEGILQGLHVQLPRCLVGLATRSLPGGDLDGLECTGELLGECARCLLAVSHHALGKTQVREAEGIAGEAGLQPPRRQVTNRQCRPSSGGGLVCRQ
jgi:hypothetical protein